jgi:hypothetical protein
MKPDNVMSIDEVMASLPAKVRWRAAWVTFRRARREGWLAEAFNRPTAEMRIAIRCYARRHDADPLLLAREERAYSRALGLRSS